MQYQRISAPIGVELARRSTVRFLRRVLVDAILARIRDATPGPATAVIRTGADILGANGREDRAA